MKKKSHTSKVFTIFGIIILIGLFIFYRGVTSEASYRVIRFRIRLHGEFFYPHTILSTITLHHTTQGKLREEKNVAFAYQNDGTFLGTLPIDAGLPLNALYSIVIKPNGYFSRVTPSFIVRDALNDVNLTQTLFYGGDVEPFSRRVDGYDLSSIMANLGQAGEKIKGDVNSDGVVNVIDYAIALRSIQEGAHDESVPFTQSGVTPTASPSAYISPTMSYVLTSTPRPTPTTSLLPTSISKPTPTTSLLPTATPKPTPTTSLLPSPTRVPTPTSSQPTPTVPPGSKTPNYAKLIDMVGNPPQIGCSGGTITNCPVETLYRTSVDKGLGWATYYGDEHNAGYNVVADVIHNRKGITMEAARAFIDDTYMQKQSHLTPEQAKKTGKVIAYGATRSPADLWKIKYMFGINDPKNPKPYFIGRVMIIDSAASNDWRNSLATLTYSYKGWNKLNWILDLSKNGFIQLPTGLSGVQTNTGEGRPGVILIDESILDQTIY